MAKKRYKFNPQTLSYEEIAIPMRIRLYLICRKLIVAFILALLVNFVFSFFFYTPKISDIKRKNEQLLSDYSELNSKINESLARLSAINNREKQVYSVVFAVDTMPISHYYEPYSDDKYSLWQYDRYSSLITHTWKNLDLLSRLVYGQSVSMDRLQELTKNKELMAECVPAIWPVNRSNIKPNIGAFGMRRHPIYKRYLMHNGIDLGGPRGVDIYATGNGYIDISTGVKSGYGKQVLINHGFGYQTRYAHLSKITVVSGQYVKRGEKIGELGNTGRSTGPHLHYEVIYMGKHLDPINFLRRDMTDEELQKIVDEARATTYEL